MSKKTDSTAEAPAVPVVPAAPITESVKMWNEIKDKNIDMFAIPGQKVNQYYKPVPVEPSKLYLLALVPRATCALPSLETAIGSGFVVELVDKYVTVTRVPAKK